MSFENEIGFAVEIDSELSALACLFAETGGFILEITPANLKAATTLLDERNLNYQSIGSTSSDKRLNLNNTINLDLAHAKECWENGLREKLL